MAKQKNKPSEELQDDNERTNSMGLFNTAEAYSIFGNGLRESKGQQRARG